VTIRSKSFVERGQRAVWREICRLPRGKAIIMAKSVGDMVLTHDWRDKRGQFAESIQYK